MDIESIKDFGISPLWLALSEFWDIFSEIILDSFSDQNLINDVLAELNLDRRYIEDNVGIELDFYGIPLIESSLLMKTWDDFSNELMYKNRYFLQSKSNIQLLDKVKELSTVLNVKYKKGKIFYRARINESHHKKYKCGPEMGPPKPLKSTPGRANPQGIPYLYLATEYLTAIGEIEPTFSNSVTLADFSLEKDIKVVDLSKSFSPFKYGANLDKVYVYFDFLRYLGVQLSKPCDKNTAPIEYIPTQYLCEFLKINGYDGVQYNSKKGSGENLVIFDKKNASCVDTHLYYLEEIAYKVKIGAIEI